MPPSATEQSRAAGVGWCSCVPAAQQSAAPALPPPPPLRGLRGPFSCPSAGRQPRGAGRAARPRAQRPLPLPGERPPRPADPECLRSCQSSVSVCLPACQPPCLLEFLPARPGLWPGLWAPSAPSARCPRLSVSRQHPHAGRLRPFPPKPCPAPICQHPRLQARALVPGGHCAPRAAQWRKGERAWWRRRGRPRRRAEPPGRCLLLPGWGSPCRWCKARQLLRAGS